MFFALYNSHFTHTYFFYYLSAYIKYCNVDFFIAPLKLIHLPHPSIATPSFRVINRLFLVIDQAMRMPIKEGNKNCRKNLRKYLWLLCDWATTKKCSEFYLWLTIYTTGHECSHTVTLK